MSGIVVVGTQWGDEGKGKIVDWLADKADIVARYQGGNNAGHTVKFKDQTCVLHLVPSGILRGTTSIISSGVVVDPAELLKEIEEIKVHNVDLSLLKVSLGAHLIMPYHKMLDKLREVAKGKSKIGTTGRGIGPAYADKIARVGLRFADLEDPDYFLTRLKSLLPEKNCLFTHLYGQKTDLLNPEKITEEYLAYYEQLKSHLCDSILELNLALEADKNILFEGAQGTFLDIDHGTYPFVTSSNTIAGSASAGTGCGAKFLKEIIGITKAYTTRVGSGPFPTELEDNMGQFLRDKGDEYGATTGRARRCGWFDTLLVKQARRLNGLTCLALTKLDVLDEIKTIKICTAYKDKNGNRISEFPSHKSLAHYTPVYEEFKGWNESTVGLTEYSQLPQAMKDYLARIEELVGVKIALASTGPKREETIITSQFEF